MRSMSLRWSTALIPFLAFATSVGAQQPPPTTPPPSAVTTSAGNIKIERLATLEYPWGMAVLPGGRLLINGCDLVGWLRKL